VCWRTVLLEDETNCSTSFGNMFSGVVCVSELTDF